MHLPIVNLKYCESGVVGQLLFLFFGWIWMLKIGKKILNTKFKPDRFIVISKKKNVFNLNVDAIV